MNSFCCDQSTAHNMDHLTFILSFCWPLVSLWSSGLLSDTIAAPERQSHDPDTTAEVKPGSMHRAGRPKLFHSGGLRRCCLLNEDPCCQVWASQLEAIHWPRLCLITFFCAWNIRRPVLIWPIGWHLKSAIVVRAGKQIAQRVLLRWVTVYFKFMS